MREEHTGSLNIPILAIYITPVAQIQGARWRTKEKKKIEASSRCPKNAEKSFIPWNLRKYMRKISVIYYLLNII